ncbi:MAG TPA: hypothetical protein VEA59_03140 [Patescibacteria group bacterium]|nr:hypothetical protein [Patescibacteria group bacterium]
MTLEKVIREGKDTVYVSVQTLDFSDQDLTKKGFVRIAGTTEVFPKSGRGHNVKVYWATHHYRVQIPKKYCPKGYKPPQKVKATWTLRLF